MRHPFIFSPRLSISCLSLLSLLVTACPEGEPPDAGGGGNNGHSSDAGGDGVDDGGAPTMDAGIPTRDGGAPTMDAGLPPPPHDGGPMGALSERLFLGTGEYSPEADWHGILRFEAAQDISSGNVTMRATPDATMPVKQMTSGSHNLNFAHSLVHWKDRDELYISSLFTTDDNHNCGEGLGMNGFPDPTKERCGSIGVLSNVSTADGAQTVARHLYGPNTRINQAHGIWLDQTRDILYVANSSLSDSSDKAILAFEPASTVDGDVAPARVLQYTTMQGFGTPVHVFVDEVMDRLFIASMNPPQIAIYPNASTQNGDVAPPTRIIGDQTRLTDGNNQTTHNVWFIPHKEWLVVGHHTNEILIYPLSGMNLDSGAGDLNIEPYVLGIHEESDDSDQYDWSTYGFFYVREHDRLYVSAGHTQGGNANGSGGPNPGGSHQIKVYDAFSMWTTWGQRAPDRRIHWDSWETYYPPQPLWITLEPN